MFFSFVVAFNAMAQDVPKPSDVFGFKVGADYKLANYEQMLTYYNKLDAASDRVQKIKLGKSVDGREMILLFISTEENLKQLDHWREISEKLSRARISETEAHKLAEEGKAIIWIDGGMHASEMAHGQMTAELAYRVATEESDEMRYIRENVIFLLMPMMNPDGLEIVSSWYLDHVGTPYEKSGVPRLWQRYVGHDNNRDWFMGNMPETQNVMKILYRKWFPQVVYNQHQTAPRWSRIFIPPFRAPVNPNINPAVTASVNEVGSAMMRRFALKEMPGAIANVNYTMWWNGGGRTVPFFHNQIGILSETAHPSPSPSYYNPENKPKYVGGLLSDGTSIFYPYPWQGGESHFRDAVDYMITGSMAVLRYGADRREGLLYGIYSMGRDAIEKGQAGDPYAYVIPAEQWDEWEAKNLVNALFRGGLEVKQAGEDFTAGGNQYEAGSYILYAAQSFRPYLMDLLEPQHYPTRYQYPGGPPEPPYDVTGWTLPMQMGVEVDRIDESFSVSANDITNLVSAAPSEVDGVDNSFIIGSKSNVSAKAVNILLGDGAEISRTTEPQTIGGKQYAAGSYIISDADASSIENLGLTIAEVSQSSNLETVSITKPKVGLYKSWNGNADEGWTHWILQQYDFDVDTLHNADVINGDLSQYQTIIIASLSPSFILHGYSIRQMPEKYTGGLGLEGTLALKNFIEAGGTLITFDESTEYAINQFGLPIENAIDGVSRERFYIPGSLIRTTIDTDDPLAAGMQETVAAMFSRSRAFDIDEAWSRGGKYEIPEAPQANVDVIARYAEDDLLMSGWEIGAENYIGGKPAMVRVPLGEGNVVLFGFRPQWRAQARGTYKLIFNAIFNSTIQN